MHAPTPALTGPMEIRQGRSMELTSATVGGAKAAVDSDVPVLDIEARWPDLYIGGWGDSL